MNPDFKNWIVIELRDNRDLMDVLDSDPQAAQEIIRSFLRDPHRRRYPGCPVAIDMGHDPIEVIGALRQEQKAAELVK